MDKHDLPVLREKHGLILLQGNREALERQVLLACLGPSNEELGHAIDRLRPRGKLTLAVRNDDPPPPAA